MSSITGSRSTALSASAAWRCRGALSAIDQALWDIKGKHFDAPVWQLLGGRARQRSARDARDRAGQRSTRSSSARASPSQDDDYTALKIILFQHDHHPMRQASRIDDLVARFAAIRETVGWEIDLGVELHRNMQAGDAVMLADELAAPAAAVRRGPDPARQRRWRCARSPAR